jgi:hypothetical protein
VGENARDTWNVYKHSDGYPRGAANVLKTTLDYFAWNLPRYEADEFAAAFCAAGKCGWLWNQKFNQKDFEAHSPGGKYCHYNGGNVRLMPQGKPLAIASKHCSDIEYRYEIYQGNDKNLRVKAYSVNAWENPTEELLFDCALAEFPAKAKELESV